ncbi:hypothetical protein J4208_00220 [Candidatus Woesearchaeota archaeon]|nr:hypothetical protein [Candidatus Woesearchaeota archaeon]
MKLKELLLPVGVSVAVVGTTFGLAYLSTPKSALTIIRDKPYFTGQFTSFYSPGHPSDLTPKAVTDDRYVIARHPLKNGRTGVSITPLVRGDDAHWFELLDLDGDHTSVDKKITGSAIKNVQRVQVPVVFETDISFYSLDLNVARIPTAEDHSLLQRLVKNARIE